MKFYKIFLFVLAIGFLFPSCGDEEEGGDNPTPVTGEALFSREIDGLTVTFTNTSTVSGTVTYAWDFGDGETSTDKNPVHTYASKGEYTVKLTVKDANGKDHSVSTKVTVDKTSPVKLDDNSFADWSTIADGFTIGDNAGAIKSFKYDFDSKNIYFYIKQEADFTDATIFDMLIDLDPADSAGYLYGLWPLFDGAELLIENSFSNDRENADLYWVDFATYHPENGTEWDDVWTYDEGNTADAIVDGTYLVSGNTVEIEFSIARDKMPGLADKEVVKVAAWTSDQDWNEIGWMPDKASLDNPETDGITIDMH